MLRRPKLLYHVQPSVTFLSLLFNLRIIVCMCYLYKNPKVQQWLADQQVVMEALQKIQLSGYDERPTQRSQSLIAKHSITSFFQLLSFNNNTHIIILLLLGRLRRVDLIISIWGSNVRPSVRPYVRPSKKSFSDSNEIWCVC